MSDESRYTRLAQDGLPAPEVLDTWEVPEASPELTERTLAALAQQPTPITSQETPTMHPTPTRKSVAFSVAIGFAIAAGLLLAFWLGRSSVQPQASTPPPTLISSAPVAAPACPACEPAPKCPEPETITIPVPILPDSVDPATAAKESAKRERPRRRLDRLRGVFGGRPRKPSSDDSSSISGNLKNPFDKAPESIEKTGTLRIGTNKGATTAKVSVDGVVRGVTPLPNLKVAPGRHTVKFEFGNGSIITRRVTVKANGTVVVRAGPGSGDKDPFR